MYYLCGLIYNADRYLAHTTRLASCYGEEANFLACHAFAAELAGQPNHALRIVDRVLQQDPAQAWAHHALAHAYYMLEEVTTGLAVTASLANTWDQSDVILTGHNRWHLALLRLMTGDMSAALGMLEKSLWVEDMKPFRAQQVEAISLAWRIELEGGVVPAAFWQEVAAQGEKDHDSIINPFFAAHFMYAYTRAGKATWVETLLQRAQQHGEQLNGHRQQVWKMGAQLLRAVHLFACGDNKQAANLFNALPMVWSMSGGSDAQLDLFARTYRAAQSVKS